MIKGDVKMKKSVRDIVTKLKYRRDGVFYPTVTGQDSVSPFVKRESEITWLRFLESLKKNDEIRRYNDFVRLDRLHQKYPDIK